MKTSSQAFSLAIAFFATTLFCCKAVDGSVLDNLPTCDDDCYCLNPPNGTCPDLPSIPSGMIDDLRSFTHTNPLDVRCDPFNSAACVEGLESGEVCAVELTPPAEGGECPTGYNYTLLTVSMQEATNNSLYITHTGPCGVCSSLQDLAAMLQYNKLILSSSQCFLSLLPNGFSDISMGVACYEDMGFTTSCAETLIQYQKAINSRNCGVNCAAFALDGDQGQPSCSDASGCAACASSLTRRLELVAGRTFARSGYPSGSAVACNQISSMIPEQGDICSWAEVSLPATDPTPAPVSPTPAPVLSTQMRKCMEYAALEQQVGASIGAAISCDCSGAETGATYIPVCFNGDRTEENQCAIQFGFCSSVDDCCSAGIRTCRQGACRSATRGALKSSLRLGSNDSNRGITSSSLHGGFRRQLRILRGAEGRKTKELASA